MPANAQHAFHPVTPDNHPVSLEAAFMQKGAFVGDPALAGEDLSAFGDTVTHQHDGVVVWLKQPTNKVGMPPAATFDGSDLTDLAAGDVMHVGVKPAIADVAGKMPQHRFAGEDVTDAAAAEQMDMAQRRTMDVHGGWSRKVPTDSGYGSRKD